MKGIVYMLKHSAFCRNMQKKKKNGLKIFCESTEKMF